MKKSNRYVVMVSYIVIFSVWFVQYHYGDGPPVAKAQLQTKPLVQMQAVSPKSRNPPAITRAPGPYSAKS